MKTMLEELNEIFNDTIVSFKEPTREEIKEFRYSLAHSAFKSVIDFFANSTDRSETHTDYMIIAIVLAKCSNIAIDKTEEKKEDTSYFFKILEELVKNDPSICFLDPSSHSVRQIKQDLQDINIFTNAENF